MVLKILICAVFAVVAGAISHDPTVEGEIAVHPVHKPLRSTHEARKHVEETENEEEGEEDAMAAQLFIYGVVATIVGFMSLFALTHSSNKGVVKSTWIMIDMVIAIFVAVLWFQAINEAIDSFDTPGGTLHKMSALLHSIHAIMLLSVAVLISWNVRRHKLGLAVFCGCGAHFVSFASMGMAAGVQETLHEKHDEVGIFIAIPIIILVLVAIFIAIPIAIFIATPIFGASEEDKEWSERVEDVANDFIAMALAVVLTLTNNYMLTGTYHNLEEIEGVSRHTYLERRAMIIYASILLPIGAFTVHRLSHIGAKTSNELVKRSCTIGSSVCAMATAWAFLQAGQWEFAAKHHDKSQITARLVFAVIASFCGTVLIVALAKLEQTTGIAAVNSFAMVSIGLTVGFSWEQTFNEAIEVMAEHERHHLRFKILFATGLGAVILPLYYLYMKPVIIAITEVES